MMAKTVNIQVLGRNFNVNCPIQEQEALHQAVIKLNDRLQDLKQRLKVTSTEQLVVVVALNLCNELMQTQQKNSQQLANLQEKVLTLQGTLERTLLKTDKVAHFSAR